MEESIRAYECPAIVALEGEQKLVLSEPVFGEPEVITAGLYPGEDMPGYHLLQALID